MTERRFSEEEVAAIFARATETQHSTPGELTHGQGMTLAEVQAIGREAGIAPDLVAQAARSLTQGSTPRVPRLLGVPLGVAHTVELGRRMSDDEWERLVVQLRDTFEARGKLGAEGSFRQWTNGNLQVLLEPSGEGHRVRFKTTKGSARAALSLGLVILGGSAVTVLAAAITGVSTVQALGDVSTYLLLGGALFGGTAIQLPSWARLRRRQMEALAAKLLEPPR